MAIVTSCETFIGRDWCDVFDLRGRRDLPSNVPHKSTYTDAGKCNDLMEVVSHATTLFGHV